jgi:tRNA G18 (ribose-2'-O)-methylase SpoU
MNIFLYAPDDFKNLCITARSLECFGYKKCYIHDIHHLVRESYGKSYSHRIRTVSAGAFFLMDWEVVPQPKDFLLSYTGRRICTTPAADGTSIYDVAFQHTDLVVFGSERKGLPVEIQKICDLNATIPIIGKTRSLNLSTAISIIIAEMHRQTGK